MRKHFLKAAAVALFAAALVTGAARADQAPSWTCVPQDTVLIVRVPNLNAYLDAMRNQTKFGAVVMSQERLDKLAALVKELPKWDENQKEMEKYGLKSEDWKQLFGGEVGYAMAVKDRPGRPLVVGLVWLEPSGDLGDRLIKLTQQAAAENKDPKQVIKRIDSKIEGVDVMQLTTTMMEEDPSSGQRPEQPADFDNWKQEDKDKWNADADKKAKESAKLIPKSQVTVFIGKLGNRILVAHSVADPSASDAESQTADIDATREVYAKFLASHSKNGDPDSNAKAILATPGAAAALPQGIVGAEVMFDPGPLVKLGNVNPETHKILATLGVTGVGPTVMRFALDQNATRMGMFTSMPIPRAGIFSLLDQPAIPAQPAEWVPASALSYAHISFDLGKAYIKIREMAVSIGGDQIDQNLQQGEAQVMATLKSDLPTVLSSLGTKHVVVAYVPKPDAAPAPAPAAAPGDPAAPPPAPAAPTLNQQQAVSIVWQVTNEGIWKTVLDQAKPYSMLYPQMITSGDEQGFSGYRFKGPGADGSIFLGKGYMAISMGSGVTETTLGALKAPPAAADSFLGTAVYAKSKTLLPGQPGIYYTVTDQNRAMKFSRKIVLQSLQMLFDKSTPDDKSKEIFEKFKALIPTEEELDGTSTAGVATFYMTDQGLVGQSAVDMPAK